MFLRVFLFFFTGKNSNIASTPPPPSCQVARTKNTISLPTRKQQQQQQQQQSPPRKHSPSKSKTKTKTQRQWSKNKHLVTVHVSFRHQENLNHDDTVETLTLFVSWADLSRPQCTTHNMYCHIVYIYTTNLTEIRLVVCVLIHLTEEATARSHESCWKSERYIYRWQRVCVSVHHLHSAVDNYRAIYVHIYIYIYIYMYVSIRGGGFL